MKTGVLLINLGTPDSPSTADVRRYLTEFLNDPRVIDISPIGRFFLVNFIIVPFRASKSAKLYSHIWTHEGSPLLIYGKKVKELLQAGLGNDYVVELGMRYRKPSIASALENLRKSRVEKIILIPLYPQYASSSTGSSIEKALSIIGKWEVIPSLEVISCFYDHPEFINAFAEVARRYNFADYDHFLFSYHGLPERHVRKSDAHYDAGECSFGTCCEAITGKNRYCYRAACFETTRLLVNKLGIPAGKYTTSFQSRLDDKWIRPYSDKVLEDLAKKGVKRVLVFSPAFVADCLETIYEIGTEYDELFRQHGGEKVQLAESLNASAKWVEALKKMVTG